MGRHKLQRRCKQKYSLNINLPKTINNDKITFKSASPKIKTPDIFESITPEFIQKEKQKAQYYNDASPKLNASRLPKLKLNLDIPENDDTEDVEQNKENTIKEAANLKSQKDLEKTLSVENFIESESEENSGSTIKMSNILKSDSMNLKACSELRDELSRTESTSLNGYLQIPSSTFKVNQAFFERRLSDFPFIDEQTKIDSLHNDIKNNPKSFESNIENNDLKNIFSEENGNNFIIDKNRNENCCIAIDIDEKVEDISNITKGIFADDEKTEWNISSSTVTSVELPAVSDIGCKTTETESQIQILNVSEMQNILIPEKKSVHCRKNKSSLLKIITFCSWLTGKIIIWIRKGCIRTRNLFSITFKTSDPIPLDETELTQVISVIKCENDRLLAVLSEKVSSLSQELIEVQSNNEATLTALKKQLHEMQSINNQLVETNSTIFKELKTLQEAIREIKLPPPIPSPFPTLCPPTASNNPSIPPPPPLPPTLPVVESKIKRTPNSRKGLRTADKTPTKKYLTPMNNRPVITVEDLLKVTLRKAPTNLKDNRRNTISGPRDAVISMDMLRNVKLKSARRRPIDQHMSPRSASKIMRNRSQSNGNLSPIMHGAEDSLRNLLKPSNSNRRILKRTQFIASSNSETDLSRETPLDRFDYPRSESVLI